MKKNLALLAIVIVIFCVIAEIALRLLGMGHPLWTMPDRWTGWRLRPHAAGWQTDEGRSLVHINADGWRDPLRSVPKPGNTVRVAVLGDSFVEGRQVNDDQTLTAVAEKLLATCPALSGKPVEVLNFGVSGYGTVQELLTLQQYVWPYDPDIVVLGFTPGNDLRNNSILLEGPSLKPVATLSGSQLVLDMAFRQQPGFRSQAVWYRTMAASLVNRSRMLQLLYGAMRAPSASAAEAGLDDEAYKLPSGNWVGAWDLTETLIEAMQAQVAVHEKAFLLMTTTQGIQIDPDAAKRSAYAKTLGVNDLQYAEGRLKELGQRKGFPVLTLAADMAEAATEKGTVFHGFANTALGTGHWNAAGHAEAGRLLASMLCTGLTPSR